jgi:hypothetical protein
MDLQHFLHDEPVQAGPPGASYRLLKLVRRNRKAVLAAASLFLLLVTGIIGTSIGMVRALAAEKLASARLTDVQQANRQTSAALTAVEQKQRQTEHALNLHRLTLADREWSLNHVARAEQLLDDCPAELRGWEWHYLKRRCHADLVIFQGRGSTPVWRAVFSPDCKRLAACRDHVQVWDLVRGQVRLTMPGEGAFPPHVTFSPDGRRLASGHLDRTVRIWETATGKEVLTLRGHTAAVNAVLFSPDGSRLVSVADGWVKIWDGSPWQGKSGRVVVVPEEALRNAPVGKGENAANPD